MALKIEGLKVKLGGRIYPKHWKDIYFENPVSYPVYVVGVSYLDFSDEYPEFTGAMSLDSLTLNLVQLDGEEIINETTMLYTEYLELEDK